MEKENIIHEVVKIIKKHLSFDYRIFLFGSWAKGDAVESSDIDIGILGKEKIPWGIMTQILTEADQIPTLRKIDVVDFNAQGADFRKNVLRYAKAIT